MDTFLATCLLGQEIDVFCGRDAAFSGTARRVVDGILLLEKGGSKTYIAIDKIISVCPSAQRQEGRPG
ncbi:MAG: hypothetical protein M5U01_23220 [Ardenticatenaceae bacterium]|nr:hypothetical protein [Ardenticatenaceae bacterium]